MNWIVSIFNSIIKSAQNWKVWLRVFILVVTGFAGAILFSTTKVKKEDCGLCISQLKEVNETIKLILSDDKAIPANYNDTLVRPMTGKEKVEALRRLSLKLDSLLKQDSINKQKTKS